MISAGTSKREAALRDILSVFPKGGCNGGIEFADDGLLYLDGGQWRLREDEDGNWHLVHNDRTPQEIAVVEQAICILHDLEYTGERSPHGLH